MITQIMKLPSSSKTKFNVLSDYVINKYSCTLYSLAEHLER
jgi:hypothetical protein